MWVSSVAVRMPGPAKRVLAIDIGYRNFAYCLLEGGKIIREWVLLDLIATYGNSSSAPKDFSEYRELMMTSLEDLFPDPLGVANSIVVERQPPPPYGSVLNIVLGEVVLAYFMVPMRTRRRLDESRLQEVRMVDPKIKFPGGAKMSYAQRKAYTVQKTTDLLKGGQVEDLSEKQWREKFVSNKKCWKLDDLADAFLLARNVSPANASPVVAAKQTSILQFARGLAPP